MLLPPPTEALPYLPLMRVLVVATEGSAPRQAGAVMWISEDQQWGSIGGGALEHEHVKEARELLKYGKNSLRKVPLGPNLGQCCGGSVQLLFEIVGKDILAEWQAQNKWSRPLPNAKTNSKTPALQKSSQTKLHKHMTPVVEGEWIVETLVPPQPVWLYGAGHVGRAIAKIIADLPQFRLYWVDISQQRFPNFIPTAIETVVAVQPDTITSYADTNAMHLIMTHDHALDLAICGALLGKDSRYIGLIGSATKAARFRKRLTELGHSADSIKAINCPIGTPELGKQPMEIAMGVVVSLMKTLAGDFWAVQQDPVK